MVASVFDDAAVMTPFVTERENSTSSFPAGLWYERVSVRLRTTGLRDTETVPVISATALVLVGLAQLVPVATEGAGARVTTSTFTPGALTGVTTVSDRGFVQLARVEREARSTRGTTICFFIVREKEIKKDTSSIVRSEKKAKNI